MNTYRSDKACFVIHRRVKVMKIKNLIGVPACRPPQHEPKDPCSKSEALSGYDFVRVGRFSVLPSLRAMALVLSTVEGLASPSLARRNPFVFLTFITLTLQPYGFRREHYQPLQGWRRGFSRLKPRRRYPNLMAVVANCPTTILGDRPGSPAGCFGATPASPPGRPFRFESTGLHSERPVPMSGGS